jgi:hypothetical protein
LPRLDRQSIDQQWHGKDRPASTGQAQLEANHRTKGQR